MIKKNPLTMHINRLITNKEVTHFDAIRNELSNNNNYDEHKKFRQNGISRIFSVNK